jgi:hypothetical protein
MVANFFLLRLAVFDEEGQTSLISKSSMSNVTIIPYPSKPCKITAVPHRMGEFLYKGCFRLLTPSTLII